MTGGPSEEHGANKPPPTRRIWERSKGDATCPTSQNPSHWHPSWLHRACATKKDSESEWLTKESPETNPITIKPETVSHMQSSSPEFLTLLLSAWPPLSNKTSCFVSTCVSSDSSFLSVRKGPILGPWKGVPPPATLWSLNYGQKFSYIHYIHMVSHPCEFSDVLWGLNYQ